MRRLLSRTSITIDEAVAILLGWSDGPIEFEFDDGDEEAEANCPVFCLRDILEEELDVLDGEYRLAKHEQQPDHVIAEKLAALQNQEATIERANRHLCAMEDEINKGEQSVLKVDRALSSAAYTYITLHSFNEWVKYQESSAGERTDATGPAESRPAGADDAAKPKPRIRLREQEDAILAEIRKQGFDPMALPRDLPGKAGVKAAVRESLKGSPLFEGATTFDKAWERLVKDGRIVRAV